MIYRVTNGRQQDFFLNMPTVGSIIKKIPSHYFNTRQNSRNYDKSVAYAHDAVVVECNEKKLWYRVFYPDLNMYECFNVPENKNLYSAKRVEVLDSYN